MARKGKEQKNFPTAANFFSAEKEYIFLNNMLASGILRNGKKKRIVQQKVCEKSTVLIENAKNVGEIL